MTDKQKLVSVNRKVLQGALLPHYTVNENGKKQEVYRKNKATGQYHRVLASVDEMGQVYYRNSVLPEDAWKSLEDAVIQEQSNPTMAVQHLRSAGLVTPEEIWATVHEFDRISEVTPAQVTIDGEQSDERDQFQTFRAGVTVPVVSKSFRAGFRSIGAYNATGRAYRTDLAGAAAQVVNEATETALFNGYTPKVSDAYETYGYLNHPDVNTAVTGGDWSTDPAFAEVTVKNIITALSADNFDNSVDIYVPTTQYNEISLAYSSADNNVTVLQRILNFPQVANVYQEKEDFLVAGTVVGVSKMPNAIKWVEALPLTIVEWQSADQASTMWRVMTIAAPRVASTYAGRSGICVSTGN